MEPGFIISYLNLKGFKYSEGQTPANAKGDIFLIMKKKKKKAKNDYKLHKVTISNKRFGNLDNTIVYLTDEIFVNFNKRKTRTGIQFIELFKQGRAIKGFKHLLEKIKSEKKSVLVLTSDLTRKQNNRYYIDIQDYIKKAQSRFFSFYRATGLDVSLSYLNFYFPKDFPSLKNQVTTQQLAKINRNFPEILEETTKTKKNQKELFNKTSQKVEELRKEEKALKENVKELKKLTQQSSIAYYQAKIAELRIRLNSGKKYSETKGKNSWQSWIYENNWMFGIQYETAIKKEKIGFNNIPDFIFPTLDGFLDILEIKLPTNDIINEDANHPGSYAWTSEANKAIGQVINYIHQIELHQLELKERLNENYANVLDIDIFTIKPRAYILIGKSDGWRKKKKEALRKLNYSLHGIEVLSYTDLLQRGNNLISLYTRKFE